VIRAMEQVQRGAHGTILQVHTDSLILVVSQAL